MALGFYRRINTALIAFCFLVTPMVGEADDQVSHTVLSFSDLDGWEADAHDEALGVFQSTCRDLDDPDWRALCSYASEQPDAKSFFELFFRPVLIEDGKDALFTGYFEPELDGSRIRTDRFRYPVYAMPSEAKGRRLWLTRRQILQSGILDNRGLEIAWVDDPVELFFLQIQGSGRIRFPNGTVARVGYAGSNGHEYRSVGVELVRRGVYQAHQVSAQVIRSWVRRNPIAGQELLFFNPSYVFFREIRDIPDDAGPRGAMNRSITAMRTVAVDPAFVPLGAPVWIEKAGRKPMNRLMVAQDTGSAIKGSQRADIFFGTGDEAGREAGRLKDPGRLVVLMPIQRAYALLPDGGS